MKGALIVMKAHQIGRLYVLQGSTVTGTAAVSSSMSSSEVQAIGHHSWPAGRGRVLPLLRIYTAFFVSIIRFFNSQKLYFQVCERSMY